jgi:hypothetical protein
LSTLFDGFTGQADWQLHAPLVIAAVSRISLPTVLTRLTLLASGLAAKRGHAMRYNRRLAASLVELLIALAIIGGLAGLILTAAMMLLKAAYSIVE